MFALQTALAKRIDPALDWNADDDMTEKNRPRTFAISSAIVMIARTRVLSLSLLS